VCWIRATRASLSFAECISSAQPVATFRSCHATGIAIVVVITFFTFFFSYRSNFVAPSYIRLVTFHYPLHNMHTNTNVSQTPLMDHIFNICIHNSLTYAHLLFSTNPYTTYIDNTGIGIGTWVYNYSKPVQACLAPLIPRADGVALHSLKAVESHFPYPFQTPTEHARQCCASGEMRPLRFGRMCKVHLRAFQNAFGIFFSGRDEGILLAFLLFTLRSFAVTVST
jgi:hypothetical protein